MSESLHARVAGLDDEGLGGAAAAVGLPPFGEEEADEGCRGVAGGEVEEALSSNDEITN